MPVHNVEIAELFQRYAALLEIERANRFRVRAYRNAARTIRDLPHSVAAMLEEGADLSELPDIGEDLAGKIEAIVATGTLAELEELERSIPGELADLVAIPGLGPKRVRALHRELKVDSLEELRNAAKAGKLRRISGFGERTEEKILEEIERRTETAKRFRLATAEQVGEPLLRYLKRTDGVRQALIAGSYRRRDEAAARPLPVRARYSQCRRARGAVLAGSFRDLKTLRRASMEELQESADIGPETARSVHSFFRADRNRKVLDRMAEAGLEVQPVESHWKHAPLHGKTFVFTGALEEFTRAEAKRRIEKLGGRATSSVSGNTDYVVVGAEPGSKLDEARQLNVRIIDDSEFRQLLSHD